MGIMEKKMETTIKVVLQVHVCGADKPKMKAYKDVILKQLFLRLATPIVVEKEYIGGI